MVPLYNNSFRKYTGLLACCLFPIVALSQPSSVTSTINRDDILIGVPVKLTVKTFFPAGNAFSGIELVLPDSIGHFEFIEKSKADTLTFKDNSRSIEQQFYFTSFDSGKWVLPSFALKPDDPSGQMLSLATDSFLVSVNYSPSDGTNQLHDIKPVMDVKIVDYTPWYIAGGILLLLLAAWLVWRYLKKRKKNQPAEAPNLLSPFAEAMQELDKLSSIDLEREEEVKDFHVRCSSIFRRFLGRKQGADLNNRTTSDLLIRLSGKELETDKLSKLAMALRCNDAVKFAKYKPGALESEESRKIIREIITDIEEQSINPKP